MTAPYDKVYVITQWAFEDYGTEHDTRADAEAYIRERMADDGEDPYVIITGEMEEVIIPPAPAWGNN